MKNKNGNVIGVISIKGGVGKTTTVANLGVSMVRRFNRRTLVIDGNLSAPNLGFHLGFIDPRITIHDVLSDRVPISQAIHIHDSGLHIIPANVSGNGVNPLKLKHTIAPLAKQYDIILLDSSPSFSIEVQAVIEASDELLIISNLELPTISTTLRMIEIAEGLNVPIRGIVLNRVIGKTSKVKIAYLESVFENSIISVVPEDLMVRNAIANRMPVVLYSSKSPASREFEKLSSILLGEEYQAGLFMELLEGLMGFLRWRR